MVYYTYEFGDHQWFLDQNHTHDLVHSYSYSNQQL